MRSLTLTQIASILSCKISPHPSFVTGYCVDSRVVKPGELFFALKGEHTDGHAYLQEIRQKGACGAVIAHDYPHVLEDFPLIRVEDPLEALQTLAREMIRHSSSRLVAITGSVGKTTTKEFTKALLASRYQVAASIGNANSQIGLPLTILNQTTGKEEIIILEMGMTEAGQLSQLIHIAPPEVAVLTTVALVHACYFESLEAIAHAKAEIFSHSQTRLGIMTQEMPFFEQLQTKGTCPKITFSLNSSRADYSFASPDSYHLQSKIDNQTILLNPLSVPGAHNRHNLLAAITVARYFKIDWKEINQVIPTLQLADRRLQFVKKKEILFLNDSYNASELSVKAALETLPQAGPHGRKIAVLGSLLELGKFSDECHARVGMHALQYVEQLYCLGHECLPMVEVWQRANRLVHHFFNLAELIECLKQKLRPSDVVLLKGSRSKKMWEVLEQI